MSSAAADTTSPLNYTGSNIITFGSRGSGALGYQFTKNFSSQLDLGLGMSYAPLRQTGIANTASPDALGIFPLMKVSAAYQTNSNFGFGIEVMTQGIASDYAFAGGVQWLW